jgi:hypothetical protein
MSLKWYVGELRMQHVQHIGMHGHIKDFTANKEGKVIAIDKLLAGCIPKDTSTASLWAWVEEFFVPLWAQVEGGQAFISLAYTHVLLNQLKNGGSVEPYKIRVEEVCSGNAAALGAEELEAAAKFQEGLLSVLEKKKKNTDDGSLSEITADRLVVLELGAHMQTRAADGEEWSEVAIVVKVGTEDKKGQLKIVGTEGSKAFVQPNWAPMQPLLMRMAPVSSKADAKDGDSAGVTVDDYSGKEKLKAAGSVAVDLDVEARLNGYQWVGVHTTAKAGHLCPQGKKSC